jgi:DMSO/TMAO reductase YedYZ molybdopterin-dependent catalytic subunit
VSYIIEEKNGLWRFSHMNKKIVQTLMLITALSFLYSAFLISSSASEVYAVNVNAEYNSEWTVQVDGEVANPVNLTLTDLLAMPSTSVYAELYCYGKLVTSGVWTGVPVSFVLETVEFNPKAESLEFCADDGYTVTFSIADVMQRGLIAYEIDDQALPETLRLVLPEANGDRWIAMITRIYVSMNESAPLPPATANILSGLSPLLETTTPQPSPTPQPSASPSPSPDPSPLPESPTSTETTQSSQNSLPLNWLVTVVATVAVASAGLAAYFKKRR